MIGVALVGFITILAASTKASVREAVDRSFRADYVVDSGTVRDRWSAHHHRERTWTARPEVAVVSPLRTAKVGRRRSAPRRSWPWTRRRSSQLFDLKVELGVAGVDVVGCRRGRTRAEATTGTCRSVTRSR